MPLWFAGFGIAFAVNAVLLKSPSSATFDQQTQRFLVPGSAIPLLIMLAIFAINYAMGVTRAVQPERLADGDVRIKACAILGLLSGLLFARAIRIGKAKKRAHAA